MCNINTSIHFRQYWTDKRLVFNSTNVDELVLNWQFLNWIWRPDTYFVNGQESYLHKVAVPNRFIRQDKMFKNQKSCINGRFHRIAPNGRVSYSQRLTVTARCRMNLRKFPHDSQVKMRMVMIIIITRPTVQLCQAQVLSR